MKLLGIIEDDFVNYKKPSMVLEFPYCSFKCNKDAGRVVCQNFELQYSEMTNYDIDKIIEVYDSDDVTQAIVCQGLEPLDSFDDLVEFLDTFRYHHDDDFVIYTGYNLDEIAFELNILKNFKNVILKVGRYIDEETPHLDKVLGVNLPSDNQYAIHLDTF